jgi:hypothetical protein
MASLVHYLFWISFAVIVITSVSALFSVFPAYWRSHSRAFLYLAFAFMLAIFDAVADHTIALWHVPREQYIAYFILRQVAHLAGWILLTAGVIGLTRSHFSAAARKDNATPSA